MARKSIKTTKKAAQPVTTGYTSVKSVAKDLNNFVLDTSDDMVNVAIVRSTQWHDVADKAIKGGLKLTAQQQDLVFTALETMKSNLIQGSSRIKTLFSKN